MMADNSDNTVEDIPQESPEKQSHGKDTPESASDNQGAENNNHTDESHDECGCDNERIDTDSKCIEKGEGTGSERVEQCEDAGSECVKEGEDTDNQGDDNCEGGDEHDNESSDSTSSNNDTASSQNIEEKPDDPQEVIGRLGDDLALARADLYNLRNEYTNYVRRSKIAMSEHRSRGHNEVLESLIPVLDDINAARDAGDLEDGPFKAIAEKLENVLATNYQFERYGTQGDEFDPNLHDALIAHDNADVDKATIAQVLQPGYKSGDTVLRATKVIVDNPV